jgi:hypothetical protein
MLIATEGTAGLHLEGELPKGVRFWVASERMWPANPWN